MARPDQPAPPRQRRLVARLRNHFLTGLVIVGPVILTFYLTLWFVGLADAWVKPFIPDRYHPDTYLPFTIPGFGLIVALVFITLLGALTANLVGRSVVGFGEGLLQRMPFVRAVYRALKQIFETVLAQSSRSFREVVLVEYPRRGIWSLGFVTGTTSGEVQERTADEVVNVFLPTTPNPTSGFLLFVPRQDLVPLDMTIEDGIKMVISGGIVAPPGGWIEGVRARSAPPPAEEPGPAAPAAAPVKPARAEVA